MNVKIRLESVLLGLVFVALTSLSILYAFGCFSFHSDVKSRDSFGNEYVGVMKNGEYKGVVMITFKNGDVYRGHVKNGKFDGKGVFKAKAGWAYRGEFKEGKPTGDGEYKFTDGKRVIGVIKGNKFEIKE